MRMLRTLRRSLESKFDFRFLRHVPRGTDLFHDLKKNLGHVAYKVVLDVGANIGQSMLTYRKEFPEAKIHSFEPFPETFSKLAHAARGLHNVTLHNCALGAIEGTALLEIAGDSQTNRTRSVGGSSTLALAGEGRTTAQTTIDRFCESERVEQIAFLKIDTEGNDLDVLKGAQTMLRKARIDIIQVEVGMNCKNALHVPFEEVKVFMETLDYFIFGIYEQVTESKGGSSRLRRTNTVFASEKALSIVR